MAEVENGSAAYWDWAPVGANDSEGVIFLSNQLKKTTKFANNSFVLPNGTQLQFQKSWSGINQNRIMFLTVVIPPCDDKQIVGVNRFDFTMVFTDSNHTNVEISPSRSYFIESLFVRKPRSFVIKACKNQYNQSVGKPIDPFSEEHPDWLDNRKYLLWSSDRS